MLLKLLKVAIFCQKNMELKPNMNKIYSIKFITPLGTFVSKCYEGEKGKETVEEVMDYIQNSAVTYIQIPISETETMTLKRGILDNSVIVLVCS